jgi:hypothetical protein
LLIWVVTAAGYSIDRVVQLRFSSSQASPAVGW